MRGMATLHRCGQSSRPRHGRTALGQTEACSQSGRAEDISETGPGSQLSGALKLKSIGNLNKGPPRYPKRRHRRCDFSGALYSAIIK